MPEIGPEIPKAAELVGEDEHHRRYGRLVAIATVITTLIGALVAFAQSGALGLHDRADAQAESDGAHALTWAAIGHGRAETGIGRLNLLTEEAKNATNASQFLVAINQHLQGYTSSDLQATQLTAKRWSAIATQTAADTASIANSESVPYICSPTLQQSLNLPKCSAGSAVYGPEQDPRFPARFVQQSQWQAYRLTALRDAFNQQADDAEAQFVHYAAALTMLAVAVFLFGYSLTPHGVARRRLYSSVAIGFVVAAGAWALFQVLSPVYHPSEVMATDFANGEVALNDGEYTTAIADFNKTLQLRPTFVDAYAGRAQAEFGAGFPTAVTGPAALPSTAGPATIPSAAALDRAIADDQTALENGSTSPTLVFDLGKDLLYRGLLRRSSADLRASRDDLRTTVARLEEQGNTVRDLITGAEMRIAEIDLALGRASFATDLHRAIDDLAQVRAANHKEVFVAAALTDLSLLATHHPSLTSRVDAARTEIVSAGASGSPTPSGVHATGTARVQLGGITAQPDPGHALFTITKPGSFDPTRDSLSVQWQYQDKLHGEWAVLPELSGPVTRGGLAGGNGFYYSNNLAYPSNTNPATCLPPGQYQVALYVNGQLAGTATATGSWPALHAVRVATADAALCVPQDWKPLPGAQTPGQGVYANAHGSAGEIIVSYPEGEFPAALRTNAVQARVMNAIVTNFFGRYFSGLQSAQPVKPTNFFMNAGNAQKHYWTYQGGGAVVSGVGISTNDNIYVGVAWGPNSNPNVYVSDATLNEWFAMSPL